MLSGAILLECNAMRHMKACAAVDVVKTAMNICPCILQVKL